MGSEQWHGIFNTYPLLLYSNAVKCGRSPWRPHLLFLPFFFFFTLYDLYHFQCCPVEFGFKYCMTFFCSAVQQYWGVILFIYFFNLGYFSESRLEGWLSIPNRANIKRYGWKKQVCCIYVSFSFCIISGWMVCPQLKDNICIFFPLSLKYL